MVIVMFSERRLPTFVPLASVNRALIDAASIPVNRSPGVFTRSIWNIHTEGSVPLALAPGVQTEIGQRDHDLITLIDQEAGDEERHPGAGGQGLNQVEERAAV